MEEPAKSPFLSKAKLGMIVAIVTIVGSILVGGANFGELKATVAQHEIRLKAIEGQLAIITENTQTALPIQLDLKQHFTFQWKQYVLISTHERGKHLPCILIVNRIK